MPRWRQYFHRFACAVMCLLIGGVGVVSLRLLRDAPDRAPRIIAILFLVFAAAAITGLVRYLQQIISEFRYDGSRLVFRTVGNPAPRAIGLSDIVSIQEWRGRGGRLEFRIHLRNGRKFYLEYSVSDSATLVNLLRTHLV